MTTSRRTLPIALLAMLPLLALPAPHRAQSIESVESIPLKPRKWRLDPSTFMAGVVPLYKSSVDLPPTSTGPGESLRGLAFTFPSSNSPDPYASRDRVGYLIHPRSWPISGSYISITVALVAEGPVLFNTQFDQSACTDQARLRLHFQSGPLYGSNPSTRWWTNPLNIPLSSLLNGQPATLTVPLTPDQWTNAVGQRSSSGFYDAMANCAWIGLTFGGCFFGHGVNATGASVQFALLDYSIY